MTWVLKAVWQEVNNLECSVVVHELEVARHHALYGFMKLRQPEHRRKLVLVAKLTKYFNPYTHKTKTE